MKIAFIILSVFVVGLAVQAQPAPEIVVTDSDGAVHDLYADYLSKGKSVMIGIFFSSCPPCQLLAPSLEQLYQDWGAGSHDVQFLQISTKDWETDETVNSFKENLNLTLPCASAEGGSLQAVDALINGGFGAFFGAPLYMVIGPDSTVQWDLFGFGAPGTIAAIDTALLATGASKPLASTTAPSLQTESLSIYPNPASEYITWLVEPDSRMSLARIYNALGQKVAIFEGHLPRISVAELTPGAHIIHLLYDNGLVRTAMFVKQ